MTKGVCTNFGVCFILSFFIWVFSFLGKWTRNWCGHVPSLILSAKNLLAGSKIYTMTIHTIECTKTFKLLRIVALQFFPQVVFINISGGFGRGVSNLNPYVLCLCSCPSLWHRELQLIQTFPVPGSLGISGGKDLPTKKNLGGDRNLEVRSHFLHFPWLVNLEVHKKCK